MKSGRRMPKASLWENLLLKRARNFILGKQYAYLEKGNPNWDDLSAQWVGKVISDSGIDAHESF